MGVCHYPWLWVGCNSRDTPLPMDDMGSWPFFSPFVSGHWHLTTEGWTLLAIDLLFCARVHPFRRNYQHDRPWYYNPNKLSGRSSVLLTDSHIWLVILSDLLFSQALCHFFCRKCLLPASLMCPSQYPTFLYLFSRHCPTLALWLLRCWLFFGCTCISINTVILPNQRAHGRFTESLFGTKTRLFLQSQWPCG